MKFFGLTTADYDAQNTVYVFPDNVRAANLFSSLGNQWRVGSCGPYALDYNVLYSKMDRMSLSADEYDELEEEIRIMEDAALDELRKD
jgi:hypothetical protein